MTGRLTDRRRAILVALLQDDRRTYRELAELDYVTLGAQGQARSIRLTPAGRAAAGEDAG